MLCCYRALDIRSYLPQCSSAFDTKSCTPWCWSTGSWHEFIFVPGLLITCIDTRIYIDITGFSILGVTFIWGLDTRDYIEDLISVAYFDAPGLLICIALLSRLSIPGLACIVNPGLLIPEVACLDAPRLLLPAVSCIVTPELDRGSYSAWCSRDPDTSAVLC